MARTSSFIGKWVLLAGLIVSPNNVVSSSSSDNEVPLWHDLPPVKRASPPDSAVDNLPIDLTYPKMEVTLVDASEAPDCSVGSQSRYRALVCWLWNAHLSLPDEQFREQIFTIVSENDDNVHSSLFLFECRCSCSSICNSLLNFCLTSSFFMSHFGHVTLFLIIFRVSKT